MTVEKNRKKESSLQHKLTKSVLSGVSAAFLISFLVICGLTTLNERKQEKSRMQSQINTIASQILTLQDSTYNLAQQLLMDETIALANHEEGKSTGSRLYHKRKAQRLLGKYTHIINGIDEIQVYSNEGTSISSRDVRDRFEPEKNEWYMDFLKSGKSYGFTRVHLSEPLSDNFTMPVISYVQHYYEYGETPRLLRTAIINIELDKILEFLKLDDSSNVSGYALFGSDGGVLYEEGTLHEEYGQLYADTANNEKKNRWDYLSVVSTNMNDGWMIVLEISGKQLLGTAVGVNAYLLLVFLVIFVVAFLILHVSISRTVTPILEVTEKASRVGKGDFDVSLDIHTGDEIELLADVFNKMVVDIRELMDKSVEHEIIYRRMQIENLMLQINPHFIYNTMNTIVYLARMNGNDKIADFANAFIALLQSTLKVRDTIYNTVREELAVVESYTTLQKYRYADKFTCRIECPEELKNCQILNVTLQPIVENAIFHGIAPMDGQGHILVSVSRCDQQLIITVSDDGVGMQPDNVAALLQGEEAVNRSGVRKIGVANVHNRIREIYGKNYGMQIESDVNKGTTVTIIMPYLLVEDGDDIELRIKA